MTWEHAHLILNHIPIVGVVLGVVLFALAVLKKSEETKRAALGLFLALAVVAFPVYFTGTQAEDGVDKLPGVTESVIHPHEEAALLSLIAVGILGLVSLVGLARGRRGSVLPAWVVAAVIAIGVVACGLLVRTGELGGRIRHTEIRPGGAPAAGAERGEPERSPDGRAPAAR